MGDFNLMKELMNSNALSLSGELIEHITVEPGTGAVLRVGFTLLAKGTHGLLPRVLVHYRESDSQPPTQANSSYKFGKSLPQLLSGGRRAGG